MNPLRRSRPILAISLSLFAGGCLFLACGGVALDAPEACEAEPCDAAVPPPFVDASAPSKDSSTAADGSRPTPDSGRDATALDGSRDSAPLDSGRDSAPLLPCDDGGLPGMRDPSFGDGGVVLINAPGRAFDVVTQPDGKAVLAGEGVEGFGLARLTTAGGLDTSFGDGGIVGTSFPPPRVWMGRHGDPGSGRSHSRRERGEACQRPGRTGRFCDRPVFA